MKKATNILKFIVLCFLFLFMSAYFSSQNGYYTNRKILVEDGIKRFEEDIKNGNFIDVNEYYEKEPDYSNGISRKSLLLSNSIGNFIRKKIVSFFDGITSNIK